MQWIWKKASNRVNSVAQHQSHIQAITCIMTFHFALQIECVRKMPSIRDFIQRLLQQQWLMPDNRNVHLMSLVDGHYFGQG